MHQQHEIRLADLSRLSEFGSLSKLEQSMLVSTVDPNDASSVKAAIRQYILPMLNSYEKHYPGTREKMKHTLWYYLHQQPRPPEDIFCEGEPIIDEPSPMMNYYIWAWEVLFPGENDRMPPPTKDYYTVVPD